MSILNLNTPQGGNSGGKKKAKMWMGAGLLAAVLGVGSTLAANITINSPEGTSEFGQGVTQTVYCGAEEGATVKVTPASSYTNSTSTKDVTIKYISNTSGDSATAVTPVTIYAFGSSNLPSFKTSANPSTKSGWWLNGSSSTSAPYNPQPSFEQVSANPTIYFFTEKYSDGRFKKPANSNPSSDVVVKMSDELTNFKLGKVVISNIPAACNGVDFVLSSYAAAPDNTAQTLSSGASSAIKEVAVLWNGNSSQTYPSRSRTSFQAPKPSSGSTCLITTEQTSTSLTFIFTNPNISAKELNKLVIETQEDAIQAGSSSCSSSS